MTLRKVTRKKAKIRLGLSAVSGGGKTYSALLIAFGICGDWKKIAIIDSENSSADLYAHLGNYNVLPIAAPFSPEKYVEAIGQCEREGMEVIIIDSITHEWDSKGGCLEIVESLGGRYQDWAKVTPRHQKFIQSITQSTCHIITTVRRKQDYEMIKDANGKLKVEKAGLKEITREGFEYELTANLEMDIRHHAVASKDRTGLFMGKPEFIPTAETGAAIKKWCDEGEEDIDFNFNNNGWHEKLKNCSTQKELVDLYNKNKKEVDANIDLQTLFSSRKKELHAKKLNAA